MLRNNIKVIRFTMSMDNFANILEIVDTIKTKVTDGEYKSLMDELQKLHKESIFEKEYIQERMLEEEDNPNHLYFRNHIQGENLNGDNSDYMKYFKLMLVSTSGANDGDIIKTKDILKTCCLKISLKEYMNYTQQSTTNCLIRFTDAHGILKDPFWGHSDFPTNDLGRKTIFFDERVFANDLLIRKIVLDYAKYIESQIEDDANIQSIYFEVVNKMTNYEIYTINIAVHDLLVRC